MTRIWCSLATYLLVSVVAGSLLTWLVYPLAGVTFERTFTRAVLLFCAVGLFVLWRLWRLDRATLGLADQPRANRLSIARAYLLALLVLLPLTGAYLWLGYHVADGRVDWMGLEIWSSIALIFAAAWLVSTFEELVFRGAVYGAMRRHAGPVAVAITTSVLYTLVHFFDRSVAVATQDAWWSGIAWTWAASAGLVAPLGYWDAATTLFLMGLILCWLRERFGLWVCVAVHAAWVFGLRTFKEGTIRDVVHPHAYLFSDYDHFTGIAATTYLVLVLLGVLAWRAMWPARSID